MAKNVSYDPQVLGKLADSLYSQAQSIVAVGSIVGLIFGAGAGFTGGTAMEQQANIIAGVGALLGLLIGYSMAQSRAFALRAQAQSILCQRQIEENTRRALEDARRVA